MLKIFHFKSRARRLLWVHYVHSCASIGAALKIMAFSLNKTLIKPKNILISMKEAVKKEILFDLGKAVEILKKTDVGDSEELKQLSNHSIEDVAVHKDLDLISVTVLIYSMYKVLNSMNDEDKKDLVTELENARKNLQQRNLGRYNRNIKLLFDLVRKSNAAVKVHLQDVMNAARIKKGAVLLRKGLSIGQAAGLMGLSNWDLQEYASKRVIAEPFKVSAPAKKRLQFALKLFGV